MATDPIALDALFGGSLTASFADPHPVYRRLRRDAPVQWISMLGRTGFLITRHEDVRAVLRDDERFSSRSDATAIGIVMGRTIVEMDDREHLKRRNLVTPALVPRALRGDFPKRARAIAHELIDRMQSRGAAEHDLGRAC